MISTISLAFLELLHYNIQMDIRVKAKYYFQLIITTKKIYLYIYPVALQPYGALADRAAAAGQRS